MDLTFVQLLGTIAFGGLTIWLVANSLNPPTIIRRVTTTVMKNEFREYAGEEIVTNEYYYR